MHTLATIRHSARSGRVIFGLLLAGISVGLASATPLTVVAKFNTELYSLSVQRTVDNGAVWRDTTIGVFQFTRTGGTLPLIDFTTFYAFCIEPLEFVQQGSTYTYDWNALENGATNIGGMGTTKANLIRELFARWDPTLGQGLTSLEAGAIQIAIWEIVRETSGSLNVSTGTTRFQNAQGGTPQLDLAQSYLSSLTGAANAPRLQNLHALTWVGAQDVVVQYTHTPEPGYSALAGLLLLGVPLARRRRSAKSARGQ
jgi:MYXO-CTERM domain-containing protein